MDKAALNTVIVAFMEQQFADTLQQIELLAIEKAKLKREGHESLDDVAAHRAAQAPVQAAMDEIGRNIPDTLTAAQERTLLTMAEGAVTRLDMMDKVTKVQDRSIELGDQLRDRKAQLVRDVLEHDDFVNGIARAHAATLDAHSVVDAIFNAIDSTIAGMDEAIGTRGAAALSAGDDSWASHAVNSRPAGPRKLH